jgi:uncharacterized protein YqeY
LVSPLAAAYVERLISSGKIFVMVREKISAALKDAMKAKNTSALSTLRMINAAIKQKDIDVARSRGDERIADEEMLSVLQGMIKSRREAIEMFRQGNRDDPIQKETRCQAGSEAL